MANYGLEKGGGFGYNKKINGEKCAVFALSPGFFTMGQKIRSALMSLTLRLLRLRGSLLSQSSRDRRCRLETLEDRRMLSIVSVGGGSAEIYGNVWNDLDADGFWGAEEPGVTGWQVYLDYNGNGTWNSNEPKATTGLYGDYGFTDLAAGTYHVREYLEDEWEQWEQTFPNMGDGSGEASSELPQEDQTLAGLVAQGESGAETTVDDLIMMSMNSGPNPPLEYVDLSRIQTASSSTPVILDEVPTSKWTYGCSATSAGMIFGYYDRHDYPNMYTGPTNDGVAPLTNLGQGINVSNPINGACSIIATQNGFDGRTTEGHVDDYWIATNSEGPDPYETDGRTEHAWGDCTADYMGTNQWRWDCDFQSGIDHNVDGSTTLYFSGNGAKTYDYIPSAGYGTPQTALSHGMKLFAESRGYIVIENYSQATDNNTSSGGFTFDDYMAQIDAGRPVMIQITNHSMVGIGYDESTQTVYLHDTWNNMSHTMAWGGSYQGMMMEAVTMIVLAPASGVPGTHAIELAYGQVLTNVNFGNQVIDDIPMAQVCYVDGLANVVDNDSSPSVQKGTDFEISDLNKPGITRTFRVYNAGTVPLTTEGLTTPMGITVLEELDSVIAPRSYDEFTIQIDTTSLGPITASILFLTNDPSGMVYNFLVTGEVVEMGLPQLYVNADAMAGGDGESWETAFHSLEAAMDEASLRNNDLQLYNDIQEIWIAEGLYTPTHDRSGVDVLGDADPINDRTATFALREGVALLGGFAGNEISSTERVLDRKGTWRHETILSGDLGVLGDSSDNAYTVVYSGTDCVNRIEGLTITGGSTEGTASTDPEHRHGAGIFLDEGSLTVANCLVTDNTAMDGAGIYSMGFLDLVHSVVANNTALNHGGGLCINDVSTGGTKIINSTIVDNTADVAGGIHRSYGDLEITSSTIAGNSGLTSAGGIFDAIVNPEDETVLNNTILAGNSSPIPGTDDFISSSIGIAGSYNLIGDATHLAGWTHGVDGNLLGTTGALLDPKFVNSSAGRYQLSMTSPALNAGNNTLAIEPEGTPILFALDGVSRVVYHTIDMGAYEFRLAGDANLDGRTDGSDVTILANSWQAYHATWNQGDFNCDGRVDGSDVTILANSWQMMLPTSSSSSSSSLVVVVSPPLEQPTIRPKFSPPLHLQPGVATVPRPTASRLLRPALVDLTMVDFI